MTKTINTAIALVLVSIFVVSITGCAKIIVKSDLDKTVSLTSMKGTRVRDFDMKLKAFWLFWGLIPLSVPKVDDVVGPNVADRTGVQNLKVTTEYSIADGLVTMLTGSIFVMRTVTIEGEVYD